MERMISDFRAGSFRASGVHSPGLFWVAKAKGSTMSIAQHCIKAWPWLKPVAVGPAEGWDRILQKIPQGQVDPPSLQLRQQAYQATLATASYLSFIFCPPHSLPISGLGSLIHRFYNLK